MKKFSLLVISIFSLNASEITITQLLEKLNNQPSTKIDILKEKELNSAKQKISAQKQPKIDIFANFTHYNHATSIRPVTPIETTTLTRNEELPFSQSIYKIGVKLSMPIFIKSLNDLSKKLIYLTQAAKINKKINMYQKEATIVGANANLRYLENLQTALTATKTSILKTRSDIKIAVSSGRMAGIAIDKIDNKLNQIDISLNNVKIEQQKVLSQIEQITGYKLKHSLKMDIKNKINKKNIFALRAILKTIKASEADYKSYKDDKIYPKIVFNSMWSNAYAKNIQDNDVYVGYGYYQIAFSIPLYDKSLDSDIQLKKIELFKNKEKYKKTKLELSTQAKFLENQIKLLQTSKKLSKNNITTQKNLLEYARIAFEEGRMTEEDYLKYETDLLNAKAKYYEVQAQIWQAIAKLAVIYGNDLKEIIK